MVEKDLGYRRVQCTGRGSYIISLPKEWVEDIGLEQRQRNRLQHPTRHHPNSGSKKNHGKRRKRTTAPKPKEYYINIDPKEPPESTIRMIRALYAIGADIIESTSKTFPTTIQKQKRNKKLASETNF